MNHSDTRRGLAAPSAVQQYLTLTRTITVNTTMRCTDFAHRERAKEYLAELQRKYDKRLIKGSVERRKYKRTGSVTFDVNYIYTEQKTEALSFGGHVTQYRTRPERLMNLEQMDKASGGDPTFFAAGGPRERYQNLCAIHKHMAEQFKLAI